MKTFKLTLALCALATLARAQFTGQSYYNHSGTPALLSSGTYVGISPGFIMAGYVPSSPAGGTANFMVDKVEPDGSFGFPTDFSNGYLLFDAGNDCRQTCLRQETNCYGVSVIENNVGSCHAVLRYALTASFDAGILFATLDNTGAVLSSALYNIPPGATPHYKPLITQSSQGGFYLCGSYILSNTDYMYAMKVSAAGTQAWSYVFSAAVPNSTFTAGGIIEDTYTGSPELAIAGTAGGSVSTDGYLITLDGATGAPNMQIAYASGQTINESLSSIALAAANGGYILGGSTDMSPGPDRAWMLNVNAGGSIVWSSRMSPGTNAPAGEVIRVAERYSAVYGAYEYYGLTLSTGTNGGMMVLKLDKVGNAFSQPGNPFNEFVYNDGNGNVALPADLSLLDMGSTGSNTGLHVFGTDQSNPGQFFMDQACFNGATANCASIQQQNLTVMKNRTSGPQVTYNFNANISSGPTRCRNHFLSDYSFTNVVYQPCYMSTPPVAPYGGNNNRMAATGTGEISNPANVLSIRPNPSSDLTELSYTVAQDGDVNISLTDILGKHIKTLDQGTKVAGLTTLQFNMNSLDLPTGVYFINVNMNGINNQQKIIFNKN